MIHFKLIQIYNSSKAKKNTKNKFCYCDVNAILHSWDIFSYTSSSTLYPNEYVSWWAEFPASVASRIGACDLVFFQDLSITSSQASKLR